MAEILKVGIVGLGLIGGSIEKALAQHPGEFEILTVSKSQQREYQLEDLVDVDILFLCGEQSEIPQQLDKIARMISQAQSQGTKLPFATTVITDVASTKLRIANRAQELGLGNFVAGHPMAGTEHKGYEASFPDLFKGATWVLAELNPKTAKLENLITQTLGARVVMMDPETHDRSVAVTSHLPLVLSLALADLANSLPQTKEVVGPGFKSMTRLAGGNVELGKEIISLNRQNIKEAWSLFKLEVDSLLEIYGPELENELGEIKAKLLELV